MKKVESSGKFRKDLKRYMNQPEKLRKLYSVVQLLQEEAPIPPENRSHRLAGNYAGCWECHIESDFLLIWIDDEAIRLIRLGSHSELFG